MYEAGLVNIITPSYNSAHLIPRLLDSILKQTYPHISMFVIDDGSTDNTKEVINKYIPLFVQKGYQLRYIYQSNGGQSAAVNNGLKLVTGEFLAWPDADDWYKTDSAIATMVAALVQTGEEVGLVRCQMEYIAEQTQEVERTTTLTPCNIPCDLLDEAIFQTNGFYYAPIGWMVKAKFLDLYIPHRDIYVHKYAGQNAQMLLPYLANTKCITIRDVHASYLVRKVSSSHSLRPYENQLKYFEEHLNAFIIPLETIKPISPEKRAQYIHFRREFYYRHFLELDFIYSKTSEFNRHYIESQVLGLSVEDRFHELYSWTRIFRISTYKIIQRVTRKVRKIFKI